MWRPRATRPENKHEGCSILPDGAPWRSRASETYIRWWQMPRTPRRKVGAESRRAEDPEHRFFALEVDQHLSDLSDLLHQQHLDPKSSTGVLWCTYYVDPCVARQAAYRLTRRRARAIIESRAQPRSNRVLIPPPGSQLIGWEWIPDKVPLPKGSSALSSGMPSGNKRPESATDDGPAGPGDGLRMKKVSKSRERTVRLRAVYRSGDIGVSTST